ncbi:telomere repeats-binding bouquet formation protein 2 [Pantherophis guttatus]|uniref:Telomere repeats-binding bouquet formation protein 2 n=1 Tax=Pantherophis guttatus TaxID=94885 RepID=A0A6P9CYW8_PANGU|nr:telomere repeats-binding bouquet formation protein 2 [Pantherophis guttatus]
MFRGRSAWFSQSVPPGIRRLWVGEGGVIVNLEAADYLFSSNASHPDTKRIYQSLDYLEDRVTVFHSCFLTANIKAKTKNTVALGHFVLLPASLQQEIRKKIGHFIWEQITSPVQDLHYSPLTLQSGPTPESKNIKKQEQLRDKKELEKCQGPRTSETGKLTYIPLQDYPSSNMVTGYTSGKVLKKFLGEIRDFIPGCSGYLAYWIPNEANVFSDVKMKLKRKS